MVGNRRRGARRGDGRARPLWKDVLLHQFHDILPGSSIAWVHDDAEAAHARVDERLEAADRRRRSTASTCRGRRSPTPQLVTACEVLALDGATGRATARASAARRSVGLHGRAAPGRVSAPLTAARRRRPRSSSPSTDGQPPPVRAVGPRRHDRVDHRHRARPRAAATGRAITLELAPDHPVEYDAWDLEAWTRGLGAPIGGDGRTRSRWSTPARCWRRCGCVRPFGRSTHDRHLHAARRQRPRSTSASTSTGTRTSSCCR